MFETSVSNRALREHLANAFGGRGYVVDQANPDFTVAYYASRRGELDVTAWDYGYRGRWGGWRGDEGVVQVRPFVTTPRRTDRIWTERSGISSSDSRRGRDGAGCA